MERGAIPFSAQFSPTQIDLPKLLELCKNYDGDRKGWEAAIQQEILRNKGKDAECIFESEFK